MVILADQKKRIDRTCSLIDSSTIFHPVIPSTTQWLSRKALMVHILISQPLEHFILPSLRYSISVPLSRVNELNTNTPGCCSTHFYYLGTIFTRVCKSSWLPHPEGLHREDDSLASTHPHEQVSFQRPTVSFAGEGKQKQGLSYASLPWPSWCYHNPDKLYLHLCRLRNNHKYSVQLLWG